MSGMTFRFDFSRGGAGAEKRSAGTTLAAVIGEFYGSDDFFSAPPRLCARKIEDKGSPDMNVPDDPEFAFVFGANDPENQPGPQPPWPPVPVAETILGRGSGHRK